jgi:hypothetical protein
MQLSKVTDPGLAYIGSLTALEFLMINGANTSSPLSQPPPWIARTTGQPPLGDFPPGSWTSNR